MLPQELRSDYHHTEHRLEYQHNGYLFDLEINKKYVMVARTETTLQTDESSKFMIRIIGRGVTTEEREQEISLTT